MPQPPAADDQAPWDRAYWAPIWLFAGHSLVTLCLTTAISADSLLSQAWSSVLWGITVSQPLICAFWTVTAPLRLVERVPLGVAATFAFGLFPGLGELTVEPVPMHLSVFAAYYATIAVIGRRRLSLGLVSSTDPRHGRSAGAEQYSTGQMLILLTLASLLLLPLTLLSQTADRMGRELSLGLPFVCWVGAYYVLLAPALMAAILGFGPRPASRRLLATLVLSAPFCAAAAGYLFYGPIAFSQRAVVGVTIEQTCMQFGSIVSAYASCTILRWSASPVNCSE